MTSRARPCVLILAGGRGSRCGGRDKGWLELGNEALVVRRLRELAGGNWSLAVSANRNLVRYRALGVPVVVDASAEFAGPLAAIAAALGDGLGEPLATVPVDARGVSAAALSRLIEASEDGSRAVYACDADGPQPLVAVWPLRSRSAVEAALLSADRSVHALQRRLSAIEVECPHERFGNINSMVDLEIAEKELEAPRPC